MAKIKKTSTSETLKPRSLNMDKASKAYRELNLNVNKNTNTDIIYNLFNNSKFIFYFAKFPIIFFFKQLGIFNFIRQKI